MFNGDLGLRVTPARVDFKLNAGQNNHFLITVLVGLDGVRSGTATLNDEFSTSWSPRDVEQSSRRSREYALVTSLAWITDLVDVYRKKIQGMRSIIIDAESDRITRLDGRAAKLADFATTLGLTRDDRDLLMLQFAIRWRNRIVHSEADNRLGSHLKASLLRNAEEIAVAHRGLDIGRAIASFEQNKAPTFKEVASFIAAAQRLVESLDSQAVSRMDVNQYANSVLQNHLTSTFESNHQVFAQFWPGNASKSEKRLRGLLLQLGFTSDRPDVTLREDFLSSLGQLSANEARQRYRATSAC
ncbi:hypothetical protein [Kocuria rhizophila]|uniref:hypothetical protein n=1 Tax=Kocuria rhizophila TaxID=72000 RepID=UPI0011A0C677|nr:hypothetical protein [Kocuria rhizophila]